LIHFTEISGQNSEKKESAVFEKDFYKGDVIRVKFLKENIVRIQISPKDKKFKESALNRYGFISDFNSDNLKVDHSESKSLFSAETSQLKFKFDKSSGEIILTDPSGKMILLNQIKSGFSDGTSKVEFKAGKDEDWIGFGDQSRDRIYHRGFVADCYVRNVKSYIPVPFFMSTNGVGILVNTSHKVIFDMCKSNPDRYSWSDGSGCVDYYVFTGNGFKELLDLYTELTGRPKLPPEWSFGLWYICRTQANDYEAVNDALNFRREEIPCDVIGLEPGWMEKNYDFSTKKIWSKERFPIPPYAFKGPHNFMNSIDRMGFKLELWLCNDYDLTYEEERRIKMQKTGSSEKGVETNLYNYVEADGHLIKQVNKEAVSINAGNDLQKDEPWFEHLKKFVDQGALFFKQDGSNQVLDHPGKVWGNGMPDEAVHNIYPLFYSRQMYEGFKEYTNRRPVVFTPCGWTGFQAWSGTWTGDTGGRLATLGAMLNTSIVGHSWSTNDMEVTEKEGIHFGYLQPWSQINSWNYFRMPWTQGSELSSMHRFYAQLRSKLIPYLYSWAYYSTKTGWPMLVPLTLEFPADKNCRNNLHQYLLGRDLMVGIYNKEIYFPSGVWKDYWTGEVIKGPRTQEISWPENRGGSLYVRSGGIVPFGPLMQYRHEKPVDEIDLYVFPDINESFFDLYEDDGVTFEHLKGNYSITRISAKTLSSGYKVEIGESKGNFEGKVENRKWNIVIAADSKPESVDCNGKLIPGPKYSWDENRKELTINGIFAPAVIMVKK
jgi:alpha-glucosidase (family GH31 glycosyl hydrolase)